MIAVRACASATRRAQEKSAARAHLLMLLARAVAAALVEGAQVLGSLHGVLEAHVLPVELVRILVKAFAPTSDCGAWIGKHALAVADAVVHRTRA